MQKKLRGTIHTQPEWPTILMKQKDIAFSKNDIIECPNCENGTLEKIILNGIPVLACDECQYFKEIED